MSKRAFRVTEVVLLASILVAATAASIGVATSSGCRTGVKPDAFIGAVVDCSTPGAVAAGSVAQIVTCLTAQGGASPTALSCLTDVANSISATVSEIVCVVSDLTTSTTSTGTLTLPAPADASARVELRKFDLAAKAAADFLTTNRIVITHTR